ncbi:MAG: SRPBCC domain-containing protein [Paludisphaera borealis]|uniref:SRPBCC family protein n=1 Tax=Paludisphaera borealis TaxID=1387353 RepID=UPI002842E0DB|nr:SRPBCC domain-containing protein [Paludisphaera borealis]MDR3620962.1 SRPBCC domain-containing protein [Paludisphaera borealis]
MSREPQIAVTVVRRFDASPERVFDAWFDPVTLGRWLFATKTGEVVRVEVDPRVGGSFVIVDRRDGEDVAHTGAYLEIDRPRRLVFDFWVDKLPDHPSRVSVDIVPLPAGCELTLTQEFSAEMAEYKERSKAGWGKLLDALAATLA